MTDEEKRAAHLEWINRHCNQNFEESDLPAGIILVLEKLMENDDRTPGVTRESFEGISVAYSSDDIPADIITMLKPYRRPGF